MPRPGGFHGGTISLVQPPESRSISVDRQTFDVYVLAEEPEQYHLIWRSGPNPGYGFSCRRSDGEALTEPQLIAQIRDFLEHINPASGYLD